MAWYNASWSYRQKITMNAALIDEVFQVLPIAGSELGSDFFDDAQTDGDDIRFTAADGTTELACHILNHDAGTDTGRYFVDVSSVSNISTDVDIYVYYGNSGASPYAANATYGADAVWDSHAGVYFPGMSLLDYTNQASGRALTAVGSPTTAASGYEGITAATYNGSSQYHHYTGSQGVTDWPMTMEAISSTNINTALEGVLSLCDTVSSVNYSLLSFSGSTGGDPIGFRIQGSATSSVASTSTGFSTSTQYVMAGTRDADAGTTWAYHTGGNTGSNANATSATSRAMDILTIGAWGRSSVSNHLNGTVSFVAITASVRSANYMATTYNAWSNAAFISATAQETDTPVGGSGSFFFGG